ncbi:DUF4395 domain-containing protein [Candidatus Kaistella beijingensis]|uniref:DUF4395 domain-containing protein n=1 Tax=Candidatus Kaistella beijingensis TaxID=2820270 RepID=UPI000ECAE1C6|nr:DUF4395 domain-containing protein [Candidatus Kaistella beijingensis]UBB90728.1 DUF4395 domain-containing protein [Candidatus Kaistella beijingensis]HCN10854.1 DUF4395 domain-containing protein [Chryseobacterium sp.]
MNKNIRFGEIVNGYEIPVLNNREIRATAGIMFLMAFISLVLILSNGNFVPVKYVLSVFVVEFFIRLFINPKYAPLLIIGRMIVSNQNPEFVGAEQKKFAWFIGLTISVIMFFLLVIMNAFSPITGFACLICLILMFSESAFGICIGCKMYGFIKKDKAQYCPGEVCDIRKKHDIQRISLRQWFVIGGLFLMIVLLFVLFQDFFVIKPHNLFI